MADVTKRAVTRKEPDPAPVDAPSGTAPPSSATAASATAASAAATTPAAHQPHHEVRPVVRVRTLVAAAVLLLAILGLIFLLAQVFSLVLDFLIAVVIAEGLKPLVTRVEELHVPRALAVLAVFLGLLVVLAVIVGLLVQPVVSEAASLAHNFPHYEKNLEQVITNIEKHLGISSSQLASQVASLLGNAAQYLLAIGATIAGAAGALVIVLVITILWLTTAGRLKTFTVDLFPPRAQALVAEVFGEIGERMGGYLRGTAINMVVVGVVTGVASWLLRLPSPILVGLFVGIAAAIPMIGAVLGALGPALLGFTVSPEYPVLVLVVMIVIQLVDANTVVPIVYGRALSLPALAIVVALLVGFALAGPVGAVLSMPIAAAIQVLVGRVLVPYIHHMQGRADPKYAAAFGADPAAATAGSSGPGEASSPKG